MKLGHKHTGIQSQNSISPLRKRPQPQEIFFRKTILLFCLIGLSFAFCACSGEETSTTTPLDDTTTTEIVTETTLAFPDLPSNFSPEVLQEIKDAMASDIPNEVDDSAEGIMNIILVGHDQRKPEELGASDSLMMLRVNFEANSLCILSIHRDLWTFIPNYGGESKITYAHSKLGPAGTIRAVQYVTGIRANAYAEMGMANFAGLIDSLGGVYVDVDHNYSHTEYKKRLSKNKYVQYIELDAGYQYLSGLRAFHYVHFRYDTNSNQGRNARQRRIITSLLQQTSAWDMDSQATPAIISFFDNISSTFSSTEMLDLGLFMTKLKGSNIKQLSINGKSSTINGESVVLPNKEDIKKTIQDYLVPASNGKIYSSSDIEALSKSVANSAEKIISKDKWTAYQAEAPFQLLAPTYLPNGYKYCNSNPKEPGTYEIKEDDSSRQAVRMTYRLGDKETYIGVLATNWTDAPLAQEDIAVEAEGTTYYIVYSGSAVDHIWWKNEGVLYSVSNTLLLDVSVDELLKVALSTQPVP